MQNEEKRKQEEVTQKENGGRKWSFRNFLDTLMDKFIIVMEIAKEDAYYEEQQDEMKSDEEAKYNTLDTLNKIISIIALIAAIIVALIWTYNRGYDSGREEVDSIYKTGIQDGASLMAVYTLSLTREDISEEKRHEVEEWFDEMLKNPNSEVIYDFINEFLEELYGISVEMDL